MDTEERNPPEEGCAAHRRVVKGGLLLFGAVLFAYNASIVLHEFGHAIGMCASGTGVEQILIYPFTKSLCIPGSAVAYPRLIYRGGSVFGSLIGVFVFGLAWRWRGPYAALPIITGVFSCLYNGLYMIRDCILNAGGDATMLVLFGTPRALIFAAGLLIVGVGIVLGMLSLPSVGIRPDDGVKARLVVFGGGALAYGAIIAAQLAVRGGVSLLWWAAYGAAFAGLVPVAAGLTKVVQKRVRWFDSNRAKAVGWPAVGLSNISGLVFLSMLIVLGGRRGFVVDKINRSVDYVAQLNDMAKAGRDEKDNAGPFYERAIELYSKAPEGIDLKMRNLWPTELDAGQLRLWKEWVESNSDALDEVEAAAGKSGYWRKHQGKFVWEIESMNMAALRGLTEVLMLRAKLSATAGRIEDSMEDIALCYRLGLHMRNSQPLVDQLVGTAIWGRAAQNARLLLARAGAGEALLEEFQRRLEQLADEQPESFDLSLAKLETLDAIQMVFADDGKGDGQILMGAVLKLTSPEASEWREELSERELLRFCGLGRRQTIDATERVFEHIDGVLKRTPWELNEEEICIDDDVINLTDENIFILMFLPGIDPLLSVSSRVTTDTAGLITTLALLRYKADRDQFPEKLHVLLSEGYLKELPMDAYSGKPLVYRRTRESFVLYSFGADFDDDGGKRSKWGKGDKGGDQVFWPVRLYIGAEDGRWKY